MAGVLAPALTPFGADGTPDPGRFTTNVQRLLAEGCHGVVLFGTTGEATSLTVAERIGLTESVIEAGVPPDRLMVGTGCCALGDTVELTRHALSAGIVATLMLPPFYYSPISEAGLVRSFAETIDRVGDERLRVYLYHFPRLSTVPITHGAIAALRESYPQIIAGLKDSTGDPQSTAGFLAEFPDLEIYPGTETLLLPMLERGGAGTITAGANVNAPMIRAVFEAFRTGDLESAAATQEKVTAVRAALATWEMIPALKALRSEMLADGGWRNIRPPFDPAAVPAGPAVAAAVGAAGLEPVAPV